MEKWSYVFACLCSCQKKKRAVEVDSSTICFDLDQSSKRFVTPSDCTLLKLHLWGCNKHFLIWSWPKTIPIRKHSFLVLDIVSSRHIMMVFPDTTDEGLLFLSMMKFLGEPSKLLNWCTLKHVWRTIGWFNVSKTAPEHVEYSYLLKLLLELHYLWEHFDFNK